MSPRRTTLRPGRPPSMVKMPPVSVVRSVSAIPSVAMWSRIMAVVCVLGEGQFGPAVQGVPLVDHVVEHGVGRGRDRTGPSRQRLSRSRAMWVTWISSVPA